MAKLWFLKGSTGETMRGIRNDLREQGVIPVKVRLEWSIAHIPASPTGWGFSLTVRGNAKDRRRQARIIQRWLNEED